MKETGLLGWLFGPNRHTRKRLSLPGLWVNSADLRDGAASDGVLSAAYRPVYLRRTDPGAPVPAGVDPDAPRYQAEVSNQVPQRFRGAAAAAGTVVTLASVAAIAGGIPWGFVTLAAGPALITAGITGGSEGVTFRRAPDGAWIEAEGEPPAIAPLRRYGPWTRAFAAAGAAIAAWLVVTNAAAAEWEAALIAAGVGALLAGVAAVDWLPIARPDPEPQILADRRFYELADPTRPLTDRDLHASRPDA